MTDYTPNTNNVRKGYAARFSILSSRNAAEEEFDRWFQSEINRAKAEALRDVATAFIDWDILYGHSPETDQYREDMQSVDFLMRTADEIEGVRDE